VPVKYTVHKTFETWVNVVDLRFDIAGLMLGKEGLQPMVFLGVLSHNASICSCRFFTLSCKEVLDSVSSVCTPGLFESNRRAFSLSSIVSYPAFISLADLSYEFDISYWSSIASIKCCAATVFLVMMFADG
jgi:hypothetical protein